MKQPLVENFKMLPTGIVTGGMTESNGLSIRWQDGPIVDQLGMDVEPNGAFLQTVVQACINRLIAFQDSPTKSRENAVALTHLETAQLWLGKREQERAERGVLGTHQP
jgi:NAD(P)H-dependent FMN reductase